MDYLLKKRLIGLTIFFFATTGIANDAATQGGDTSVPYLDDQFACITGAKAQQYVNDFNIDVAAFGGMELCKGTAEAKKLFNDLQILEDGRINSNKTSNVYIRGFIPADKYYEWMKTQTRGMDRGNDVPFATAYNSFGYFTMQDGWAKLSTLGRVGTIVHEARHTAGYRHIPCRQGPYAGASLDGCDKDYGYGGSHAIEMEYYARVSVQGDNFHPVYRQMARLMGIARSNFTFNVSPIKAREGLLVVEKSSRTPVLYDGSLILDRDRANATGKLKRTSFGAVYFDGLSAVALEMYEKTGFSDPISDAYSYFKLLTMNNNQRVKDFEEYDINNKRYVVQATLDNKIQSYGFPRGKWNNPTASGIDIKSFQNTLENGQKGLFVISATNDIKAFDAEKNSLGTSLGLWNPNFSQYALYESQVLGLGNDGNIYAKNGTSWAIWPKGTTQYEGMVNVPLYDGYEVIK
jgi:hypothetical protein